MDINTRWVGVYTFEKLGRQKKMHRLLQANESSTANDPAPEWLVFMTLSLLIFYFAIVLITWPYVRPVTYLPLLLLCIFLPPLFPFLLLYLMCTLWSFSLWYPRVFVVRGTPAVITIPSEEAAAAAQHALPGSRHRHLVEAQRHPR